MKARLRVILIMPEPIEEVGQVSFWLDNFRRMRSVPKPLKPAAEMLKKLKRE